MIDRNCFKVSLQILVISVCYVAVYTSLRILCDSISYYDRASSRDVEVYTFFLWKGASGTKPGEPEAPRSVNELLERVVSGLFIPLIQVERVMTGNLHGLNVDGIMKENPERYILK